MLIVQEKRHAVDCSRSLGAQLEVWEGGAGNECYHGAGGLARLPSAWILALLLTLQFPVTHCKNGTERELLTSIGGMCLEWVFVRTGT